MLQDFHSRLELVEESIERVQLDVDARYYAQFLEQGYGSASGFSKPVPPTRSESHTRGRMVRDLGRDDGSMIDANLCEAISHALAKLLRHGPNRHMGTKQWRILDMQPGCWARIANILRTHLFAWLRVSEDFIVRFVNHQNASPDLHDHTIGSD